MGSSQEEEKRLCQVLVLVWGREIRVVEVEIGGGGKDATATFRMGRRSPLWGWGAMWGCQGVWQVETQRPVTGGEHGSVREDRSERDGGGREVRPV